MSLAIVFAVQELPDRDTKWNGPDRTGKANL
jgi:hypothetical protein